MTTSDISLSELPVVSGINKSSWEAWIFSSGIFLKTSPCNVIQLSWYIRAIKILESGKHHISRWNWKTALSVVSHDHVLHNLQISQKGLLHSPGQYWKSDDLDKACQKYFNAYWEKIKRQHDTKLLILGLMVAIVILHISMIVVSI